MSGLDTHKSLHVTPTFSATCFRLCPSANLAAQRVTDTWMHRVIDVLDPPQPRSPSCSSKHSDPFQPPWLYPGVHVVRPDDASNVAPVGRPVATTVSASRGFPSAA